ncbi:AAA family ATPase [Pectobacterium brasiliense]|uniref:AAA family ATPase n=1 Tax=Pectobacterium brasiliense TaxID=180957 RepID=UPI00196921CE|nr:ATP-binding protein [Pectobacterium brasiliense]MBN3174283.1 AAA family ATPase [Pectobacterium brasiliense]
MQHTLEILKVIEGALSNNLTQVTAYSELLASKLEKEGDARTALSIRKKLDSSGTNYSTAGVNGRPEPIVPVDKDSRLTLGDVLYPTVDETRIQLPTSVQENVDEFLSFISKAHLLSEAGVGISPSMMLYGPPGCGKTQLAHHIAARLGLPLITARCDTLISSFLGSTAKNIRSLFDHAASRPCVLFLDEFDAFAKARDDQHELGELKRVVVSLLQNIDALPENTILLAATNHHGLLDPAVWRRFAYRLKITLPNKELRCSLIEQFLGGFCPKSIKRIVDATEGMSGAMIQQACKTAIRNAILSGQEHIDIDKLIIGLAMDQYQDILSHSELSDEDKIIKLRMLNGKVFTIERLAAIFGLSTGKISTLTSKKDSN